MDIAEKIAATYADIVYLGVGLHSGYEISSLLQNLDIRFPGNCHKFLAASHTTARQGPGPCFYLPSSPDSRKRDDEFSPHLAEPPEFY